jgi:Xaa-Pro aminopeptidase
MGMIKTEKEIKLLKKSAQITDSCIKVIEDSLKEDITEIELRRRIRRKINSQGAALAFQTLVACGKRSSMIHPKPHATNGIISGIGYADFGASYRGYKTDVTVPFIKGKASDRERSIFYDAVRAYKIGSSSIKLGQPCWKPFKSVNDFLKKSNFRMMHALGHGLGKKVHEYPVIVMPSHVRKMKPKAMRRWERIKKMTFQKNMVFAFEPGIYVRGRCGCRIENDFLMTKRGPKALTHSRPIVI